ncbi:hypothetical protein [Streptomyces sp. f51]|uniref:hypothetical protein n=1 Tax=Streptomyces sp. f51 TaxID=1827742 RepID=UPI000BEF7FB4|nr:hypothetical protein [Streptomyces sp. f51]
MDAGLAGLIGALGGGLIGAAGASAAALIAFRGARYQVNRQTEATREQWLRQIRRDLYIGFITACRACSDQIRSAIYDQLGQVDAAKVAAWNEAAKASSVAYRSLELEAPAPLVRMAWQLLKQCAPPFPVLIAAGASGTLSETDLMSAIRQQDDLYAGLEEFVEACRESLHSEEPIRPQRWVQL